MPRRKKSEEENGMGTEKRTQKKKTLTIEDAEKILISFLSKIGLDPRESWDFEEKKCSIFSPEEREIIISLFEIDDGSVVCFYSPVSFLPEDSTKILPFYKKCLDLNFDDELTECSICSTGQEFGVINQRYIVGLDEEEIRNSLASISDISNRLGNFLEEKYGAKKIVSVE